MSTLTTTSRKLVGLLEIKFKMVNETGLLIRAPQAKMVIGGADQQSMSVRKIYTVDGQEIEVEVPFIPGSSLKGRMRSLLEQSSGSVLYDTSRGIFMHVRDFIKNYCKDIKHDLDNLFGSPSIPLFKITDANLKKQIVELYAPTRLIVRDMYPSEEYVKELYSKVKVLSLDVFLEEKSENRIDRITSAADPRTVYRVKPGVEFDGEFKILIYDIDVDENKLGQVPNYVKLIAQGLKLVEDTYLGGCGTRGYGKVKFKDVKLRLKTIDYYRTGSSNEIHDLGNFATTEEFLRSYDEVAKKIIEILKHKMAN
ncbi:MAG: type III-A CRISPR-associated RAMP protein Csm3 [Thermoprotei archaeon]|nr:MAG: type III-A CRISPR-associated RAMP protein Csm3 [Thermoprotei archaeon]